MRRAVALILLVAALPLAARASKPEGTVDAVGMLDFKRGPRFKVGDWVRYRTKGESQQGYRTDYTVTVLIAGEELWWGEECFWIETQTSYSGQTPEVTASLMSYAIFQDTLPSVRFARYIRKFFEGLDEQGIPVQQLFQRAPAEITTRGYAEPNPPRKVDTLGVGPVEVPMGKFDALRVNGLTRETTTQQDGDSTVYFERTEERSSWWSDRVPLTSLVREDMVETQRRRAWVAGESENAPLRVVERATGATQLLDFGSGMKSLTVPERLQHPLGEQKPTRAKPAPPRRPAAKRG